MIGILKKINDLIWFEVLKKYRTRAGWHVGRKFNKYHIDAQNSVCHKTGDAGNISRAAMDYKKNGWASFTNAALKEKASIIFQRLKAEKTKIWDANGSYIYGDIWQEYPEIESAFKSGIKQFVEQSFNSQFKIFYGKMFRSSAQAKKPEGSQLWHADGGPGTCMNLMFCISDVDEGNGAMELLDWTDSLTIMKNERSWVRETHRKKSESSSGDQYDREQFRADRASWYQRMMTEKKIRVHQPVGEKGMVLAFNNNLLHKGGFSFTKKERVVCIFHIYPSKSVVEFDYYRQNGIAKVGSCPESPDF